MSSSTTTRTGARGGSITVAGQLVKTLIQVSSVVVLSRLLEPADFGLIAMVMVFVGLGEFLRDFGVPTAALQARTLSHTQASNLLWVSTGLGVIGGCVLVLCSPLIVNLFSEPRLASIIPALAVVTVVNGLQAQLQVKLARDHRFGALAASDVGAQFVALLSAIAAALAGWGYWALVVQILVAPALLLIVRSVMAAWIPGPPRRDGETLPLLRAGAHLGVAHLLTFAAGNVDSVVIGSRFTPTALGFYNRAFQLVLLPVNSMLTPLTSVALPMLNEVRRTGGSTARTLARLQFAVGFFAIGVFAVAIAVAGSALPLVLGSDWERSVPLFQILAIGGIIQVLSHVNYWVFLSESLNSGLLKYNLLTKSLTVAVVAGAAFYGITAVAVAYTAALAVSWPIGLRWLARGDHIDFRKFLSNGVMLLVAAAAAATTGLLIQHLFAEVHPVILTVGGAGAALLVYLSVVALLPTRHDLAYLRASARQLIRSRRSGGPASVS